jgi:hypothetical protein
MLHRYIGHLFSYRNPSPPESEVEAGEFGNSHPIPKDVQNKIY